MFSLCRAKVAAETVCTTQPTELGFGSGSSWPTLRRGKPMSEIQTQKQKVKQTQSLCQPSKVWNPPSLQLKSWSFIFFPWSIDIPARFMCTVPIVNKGGYKNYLERQAETKIDSISVYVVQGWNAIRIFFHSSDFLGSDFESLYKDQPRAVAAACLGIVVGALAVLARRRSRCLAVMGIRRDLGGSGITRVLSGFCHVFFLEPWFFDNGRSWMRSDNGNL